MTYVVRQREGGRGREERERKRGGGAGEETGRQAGRQAGIQRDRPTDRQTDGQGQGQGQRHKMQPTRLKSFNPQRTMHTSTLTLPSSSAAPPVVTPASADTPAPPPSPPSLCRLRPRVRWSCSICRHVCVCENHARTSGVRAEVSGCLVCASVERDRVGFS